MSKKHSQHEGKICVRKGAIDEILYYCEKCTKYYCIDCLEKYEGNDAYVSLIKYQLYCPEYHFIYHEWL